MPVASVAVGLCQHGKIVAHLLAADELSYVARQVTHSQFGELKRTHAVAVGVFAVEPTALATEVITLFLFHKIFLHIGFFDFLSLLC